MSILVKSDMVTLGNLSLSKIAIRGPWHPPEGSAWR